MAGMAFDSEKVRINCAKSLGKIGGEEAVTALETGIKLQSEAVRAAISAVLEQMTGKPYPYERKVRPRRGYYIRNLEP